MAIAPVMVPPMTWIAPLLERIPFAGMASLNRFLGLLMTRGNAVFDPAGGPARITAQLAGLGPSERRDFAAGFTALVKARKAAWPARALAAADKRMLARLASAATVGVDDDLAALLPAWIAARHRARQ